MNRTKLCLVLILSALGVSASAQLAPPRRPFLFKDDRGDLASARARGEREVTVVIAAMPGATAQLASVIARMGGTIRFLDNNVDYIRARVPVDSVERLVRDPLVHSLDVNMAGEERGFSASELTGPLAPADALPFTPDKPLRGAAQVGAADSTKATWPPVQSDHSLTHRYDPLGDMGALEFRKQHPTWDGRGVTLALIDLNPDPLEQELQVARTLDGKVVKKIQFYTTAIDQADEDEGRWLKMDDQVTATGGTFTWDGKTYRAPHDGVFRIANLDEARFDSLSKSGLEKDLNRDGNPPGSSRLFAVLWDEKTNDVWVDTNQNLSFTDEKALTDYSVRPEFGVFGKDNPKTAVRESVGFAVQIDAAKKMVAIDAGVPFHASLIVGAALGSRGTHGRFDGVAPGARLASYAEGSKSYGQTEAVILAFENPQVDGAWLEQSSNITHPYLLRDGRLVPTVIYSRLIEKYKKPLMIPTHNFPTLAGSDDFVLADCGIGVGGHESKANFLTNYGFRTKYDDNLLITGGYGPMGNGAFGPTIISPSNIMSGYRGWEDPKTAYMASVYRTPAGYLIAGGTSTATPTASGAVALLISAAKQTGVKYDACSIKEAIAMSARYVPNIPVYKQGNGVINVAGAWELLKQMDKSHDKVTITSSAPVKHVYSELLATPNEGVGLYEREGWSVGDRGQRKVTFTRTSGPSTPMTFTLGFTGDSGTFSAPRSVVLPLNEAVPVTVDIAPRSSGAHSALLTLDNPTVPGHAYRMLAAIVAAESLDAANHYTVVTKAEVPRPEMRSYFYRVPAGASALTVQLDAPKRTVQLAMIEPDARTVNATHIVAERGGRGGGGGGGGADAPLPKETFIAANPVPGVWEIRLTDIEDTRTFDWRASEKGGPVPPTAVTITVSTLAADINVAATTTTGMTQGGGALMQTAALPIAGSAQDVSLSNRMASFTGGAASYPLGSARRERPTIADHAQQIYEVEVPAGSAALMAKVSHPSDPKADLDVYVYDCSGKECHISANGAGPLGEETVIVQHPAAGRWKIVVDASSAPTGTTSYDYADVVFNPVYGMVSVSDLPGKHEGAVQWSAKTDVWAASLPGGREPYAAFLMQGEATRTQLFTVGLFELPTNHRGTGSH